MDGCRKNDEKIHPYCHPLYVKTQICIGIAKIKKLKTWPLSRNILDQGHVLGNANFDPGKQICVFTSSQCFFLRLKMTIVLAKLMAITVIKNHSPGIRGRRMSKKKFGIEFRILRSILTEFRMSNTEFRIPNVYQAAG